MVNNAYYQYILSIATAAKKEKKKILDTFHYFLAGITSHFTFHSFHINDINF